MGREVALLDRHLGASLLLGHRDAPMDMTSQFRTVCTSAVVALKKCLLIFCFQVYSLIVLIVF